jgi:micrococcal nuclease
MYEYQATVLRIIDGDTIKVDIDLGLKVHTVDSVRLAGLNAPGLSTDKGKAARDYLVEILPVSAVVALNTVKPEKYGRWLAHVLYGDIDINQAMIDSGHAVVWDGKGERPG